MDLAAPDTDRVTTTPDTPAAIAAARSSPSSPSLLAAPPPPPPRAPLVSHAAQLEQAAAEAAEANAELHAALPAALARLRERGAAPPTPKIPSGRFPVPALRTGSTG